uniref:Phosphatase and actin regulator n=1 Tax=Eptatretus burgeri TaxID=7764 RepID=A0A8C4RAF3_EPTBU
MSNRRVHGPKHGALGTGIVHYCSAGSEQRCRGVRDVLRLCPRANGDGWWRRRRRRRSGALTDRAEGTLQERYPGTGVRARRRRRYVLAARTRTRAIIEGRAARAWERARDVPPPRPRHGHTDRDMARRGWTWRGVTWHGETARQVGVWHAEEVVRLAAMRSESLVPGAHTPPIRRRSKLATLGRFFKPWKWRKRKSEKFRQTSADEGSEGKGSEGSLENGHTVGDEVIQPEGDDVSSTGSCLSPAEGHSEVMGCESEIIIPGLASAPQTPPPMPPKKCSYGHSGAATGRESSDDGVTARETPPLKQPPALPPKPLARICAFHTPGSPAHSSPTLPPKKSAAISAAAAVVESTLAARHAMPTPPRLHHLNAHLPMILSTPSSLPTVPSSVASGSCHSGHCPPLSQHATGYGLGAPGSSLILKAPSRVIEELNRTLAMAAQRLECLHNLDTRSPFGSVPRLEVTEATTDDDDEDDSDKENMADDSDSDDGPILYKDDDGSNLLLSALATKVLRKDSLAVKLSNRPSREELEDKNILPRQSDAERQELWQQIGTKLTRRLSQRPTPEELEQRNILRVRNEEEEQEEKQEIKRRLSRKLSERPTVEELREKRILIRFNDYVEVADAQDYDRRADKPWTRLTAADKAAIRKELNEFKSTEMEVHELSRHLTRFHKP